MRATEMAKALEEVLEWARTGRSIAHALDAERIEVAYRQFTEHLERLRGLLDSRSVEGEAERVAAADVRRARDLLSDGKYVNAFAALETEAVRSFLDSSQPQQPEEDGERCEKCGRTYQERGQ